MPRYNIELRTEDRVCETLEMEQSDLCELRIEMATFVGELLREHADKVWEDKEWRVDVTDENGFILYVMRLTATDSVEASAPLA